MNNFYIDRGWVFGISDGLSLNCGICGKHTNYDYEVDDEFWKLVVPAEYKLGVVCLDCLDKLAKRGGYFLAFHLLQVQYTGIGETIILKPETVFNYPPKKRNLKNE